MIGNSREPDAGLSLESVELAGGVGASVPTRSAPRRLRRRWGFRRVLKYVAIVILLIVLAAGGWVGWKVVRNTASHGGVLGLLENHKLKGEDRGQVNFLLAGDSSDDPGHGGSDLTDSIMVVSLNTTTHKAVAISIPRDLWVNIPGNGYQKINAAYEDGQSQHFSKSGYAAGGMGLLEETVEQYLGVSIDYYALVNYGGFKAAVDAVGGITINLQSADPRGIYDPNISKADDGPLILKNGLQTLDGQTALNLARARNDPTPSGLTGYGLPGGDFDRATNQRLMLAALGAKASSIGTLDNPIKIGQLLDSIGDNIQTDLVTSDFQRLYTLVKSVPSSSFKSVSLQSYLKDYTTTDGQSALVPAAGASDFSQIRSYVAGLLSGTIVATPDPSATVEILNGSSRSGLAAKVESTLTAKGYDVAGIGDAPVFYATTTIIDNSGGTKANTLKLLEQMYGNHVTTNPAIAADYDADFIVILGADQVPN